MSLVYQGLAPLPIFFHPYRVLLYGLIPSEYIPSINFGLDVIQDRVIPICDDGLASLLEVLQVINHQAAEEGGAVVQRGLTSSAIGYVMA